MNFFPEIERQSLAEIKAYQSVRLQELLAYVSQNSPYYRELFRREKIDISKIKTVDDLPQIPTCGKVDLFTHNDAFICVPRSEIRDYVTTSGTSGDPVTFALTENDLERLAYNEAISFSCAGARAGDVFQLMTTLDKRFMAGLAYFLGIRKLSAGIIRVGNGIPELQWESIARFKPTTLICVPSFIVKLVEYAERNGIDYKHSSVKKAVCIGENLREQDFSLNLLGQRIKSMWDIELYSTYASTEMASTFTECACGQGGHHHPELLIVELLDEQGQPVPEGEVGELTVSTLGVEAMPLLRFRTGDLCRFHHEPCACGRNTLRISPIVGRLNQMIKVKGTTLYPPVVFDILDHIEAVKNYVVEISSSDLGTDVLKIFVDCPQIYEGIEKDLKDKFRAKLRIAPELCLLTTEEILQMQKVNERRKPIKFIDNRRNDYGCTSI